MFGTDLQVYLGQRNLPWDSFASTTIRFLSLLRAQEAIGYTIEKCYAVCRQKLFDDATKRGLSMIYLILTLRTWLQESDVPISPSELLLLCKDREATVPSDMVYAISGFFGVKRASSPAISFPIDYGLSTAEVYKRFTCWCIQQERNLDILAQQRNEDGASRSSLGSWATDWNDQVLTEYNLPETSPLLSRLRHPSSTHSNVIPSYRRRQDILTVRGFIVDDFANDAFCLDLTLQDSEQYQQWLSKIPDDERSNELLFGERCPTVETLERLHLQTEENDPYVSHLWRDGKRSNLPVREPGAGFRASFVTNRGCLAFSFMHFGSNPSPKICYLLGGRCLFVLKPVSSGRSSNKAFYSLITGDCFINGFEDGKGYQICKALGLQEQDICIV